MMRILLMLVIGSLLVVAQAQYFDEITMNLQPDGQPEALVLGFSNNDYPFWGTTVHSTYLLSTVGQWMGLVDSIPYIL